MIIFHGTTEKAWRRRGGDNLYLTRSLADAAAYAIEESERDGAKPVVLSIDVSDLEGLAFEPDWGGHRVDESWTWERSLREFGSFSVSGDVEAYKKRFGRVPKRIMTRVVIGWQR